MSVKKRHYLSSRLTRALLEELEKTTGIKKNALPKKPAIELIKSERFDLFLLDGSPALVRVNDTLIPTLNSPLVDLLPSVVVDMGAVPHVCNGADVMVPGIVRLDDFPKDAVVVVRDEKYGKPLVVGKALLSSDEIRSSKRGRAIENLHYVGDRIWKLIKELSRK